MAEKLKWKLNRHFSVDIKLKNVKQAKTSLCITQMQVETPVKRKPKQNIHFCLLKMNKTMNSR